MIYVIAGELAAIVLLLLWLAVFLSRAFKEFVNLLEMSEQTVYYPSNASQSTPTQPPAITPPAIRRWPFDKAPWREKPWRYG